MDKMDDLPPLIENGAHHAARTLVRELLSEGYTPEDITLRGLMPGMQTVGEKFAAQEIFIPEMLLAARAFKMAGEVIRGQLICEPRTRREKVVIGTVQGDLHDIGKNLVAMMIRSMGFTVIDLGVDVPAEQFVRAVEQDDDVRFAALSALLTITLPAMKQTVQALRQCKAAERIQILVGGAPVTSEFAKKIGADVYTTTAFEAARIVRERAEGFA